MRAAMVLIVLATAACGGAEASGPAAMRATTTTTTRLTSDNAAALAELASPPPAQFADDPAEAHDTGHDLWGPVAEEPLDAATAAALEEQWADAVAVTARFATPEDAEAAGYQKAAAEAPGVGAHYVRWDLVDAPFDPARPSMLLYDESTVRPTRLAGFSYWVRTDGDPPEGFAGPNDRWHRHLGMCFRNGFLVREHVQAAGDCEGDWVAGTDLWMLHAWVVPDLPNPWGRFAPRHPAVCPAPGEQVADPLRCPEPE